MYLRATCKKCNKHGLLDIGLMTNEEVNNKLHEIPFCECRFGGYHVEIGTLSDYIIVDYTHRLETAEPVEEGITCKHS